MFLSIETAQACEPGEVLLTENPLILEPRSDEFRTENVETVSLENNLMLGDVFDGIDLQDASVRSQHKDFFDEFELIISGSGDFASESCVNLCEALDVDDYGGGDDGMAKQAIDFVQSVPEKPSVADEVQVDSVVRSKEEEVPKLVGVLETNDEEMGLVTSSQVLTDSILQMVEDDDEVEEGEISGDDGDYNMLVGDDFPMERHVEETHVSQEDLDKRGEGTSSKSTCFEVVNGETGVKENDLTSKNQEQVSECHVADYILISCMAFTKADLFLYIFVCRWLLKLA